jgi:hypothetical protein
LSEAEVAVLRDAGCKFDATDQETANRLARRGFSVADFIEGYRALQLVGYGQRRLLDELVVYRYLNLPLTEYAYYRSGWGEYPGSLTDFYNWRIGGTGLKVGGWVLFALGAANALGGLMFYANDEDLADSYPPYSVGADPSYWRDAGTVVMVIGGIMAGAGLPMGITGSVKQSKWVPTGVLETGSKAQMQRYRLEVDADSSGAEASGPARASAGRQSSGPQVGIYPVWTPDLSGAFLGVRF